MDTAHLAILLVCLALLGYGIRLAVLFTRIGPPRVAAIVCLLLSYGCLLTYAGWVAIDNWSSPPQPRLFVLALGLVFGVASAFFATRSYEGR